MIGRSLETGVTVRHGSQNGDIASRRASDDAKSLRIKMELCGVRAEPTNGCLHIVNRSGKHRFPGESIFHGGSGETTFGQR